MILNFTPDDGGPVQSFDLSCAPDRLMGTEARVIEKATGMNYEAVKNGLKAGNQTATSAVLFVLQKRTHPTLKWDDFDYPADAVEVVLNKSEVQDVIDQAKLMPMDDEQRATMDAMFADQLAKAPDAAPKARSISVSPSTD